MAILKGYHKDWEGRGVDGRVVDLRCVLVSSSAVRRTWSSWTRDGSSHMEARSAKLCVEPSRMRAAIIYLFDLWVDGQEKLKEAQNLAAVEGQPSEGFRRQAHVRPEGA